jgi:dipeptidyl aminopeptidase/acylaminoacyl peptidase
MQPAQPPSGASRPLRFALGAVLLAAGIWALCIGAESFRAARLNFVPEPPSELLRKPDATGLSSVESVRFKGGDGARIAGWFVPPKNHATVVLLHGTSADRTSMLAEASILAKASFGVLLFDWPGYGESEGEVRWGAPERAALAGALDWLVRRPDIDPNRIGGLGFSMGAFMLTEVAPEEARLKALALAASPTDMREQTRWESRRWGPFSQFPALLAVEVSGMPLDDPPPVRRIAELRGRPVFVYGGDADETVPPATTKALFDAAREPKELWLMPGAHHGGYDKAAPGAYGARLVDFFTRALKPSGST